MATATTPPQTAPAFTSVDPMYAEALAQAKAALAAQTAPIQGEQASTAAGYTAAENDATGSSTALASLLKGLDIPGAIQGDYQTAASDQNMLAHGFSAGMQDALKGSSDGINSLLDRIGAPSGQRVGGNIPAAGDALAGIQGLIPAQSWERQGAAQAAAAEVYPATALLQGAQNRASLQAKAAVADQGFQAKISELAGNLPGDVQTNYAALQKAALEDAKFREQVANDKTNAAYKSAELKLAQDKYSTSVDEFNAKQKLAGAKYQTSIDQFNAKQTLAYQKLANTEFNQNRDYAIKLANLKISAGRLQQTILKNSFAAANGGLSQKEVKREVSIAQSIAMDGVNGHTVYSSSGGKRTAQTTPVLSYAESLQRILAKGIAVQIALDALDRAYPASERPTPAVLAHVLGPLDPVALKQVAAANAAVKGAKAAGAAEVGGLNMNSPSSVAGGFLPQGAQLAMGRADQGRDIQTAPGTPILAPGDGVVIRLGSDPGTNAHPGAHFGPSYPIVHFTSGPYAGMTMYIGHTVAQVKQGQTFKAGATLSLTGSGGAESGYAPPGWAEIGFAPNGTPGGFGQKPPF